MTTLGLYSKAGEELQTMQAVLKDSNHKVHLIQSRDELFSLISSAGINILIMDYKTPDHQNGFVITQELRENVESRDISIVMKIDREDIVDGEISSQGVNDFLLSPFHTDEFLSHVEKLANIEKRRPFQSLLKILVKNGSLMGKTLNISSTGLLVQVPRELSVGSNVTVHFYLPHSKEEIKCESLVRRRAPERLTFNPCYGIEFIDLPEKMKDKMERFIKRW